MAGAAAAIWFITRPEPIEVSLATVDEGLVEATVVNTRAGTVEACRRSKLALPAGGQISQMWVKAGDRVKRGQKLLELWNRDLNAQAELARGQMATAQQQQQQSCILAANADSEATVLLATLVATWLVFVPLAFPVLSPEGFARWQRVVGIAPAALEVGHQGAAIPQHYADRFGWEEMAAAVSQAYRSLTPEERSACVVIAANYGRAAALEYWARKYDLPPVISGHNSYWFWGPGNRPWSVVITVGIDEDDVRASAADVRQAAVVDAPWALSRHQILVARGLTRSREQIWQGLRFFI